MHRGSHLLMHQPLHGPISSIFTMGIKHCLSRHFSTNREWEIHNSDLNNILVQLSMLAWDLFGLMGEQEASSVLLQSCPGHGLDGRCLSGVMERSPGVCLPSRCVDTTTYMENLPRQISSHPDCAQLAKTVLVYGSTEALILTTCEHPCIAGTSNAAQGQVQVPQSKTSATQSLVFGWASEIEHSCSTRVQSILSKAERLYEKLLLSKVEAFLGLPRATCLQNSLESLLS